MNSTSGKGKRLPAAVRHQAIRDQLAANASISISAMAQALGVSEMTIRRDLAELERTLDIRRTHGGAVVAERMVFEFNYRARQREQLAQKRAIAKEAAKLIDPGQRIILDTGTTTLELARQLKDFSELTIITPSLAVASELQFSSGLNVILLGGRLHEGSPDLTGPVTEHCLDLFAADWAFQGAEAIGRDGSVYNVDLQLAQVDRKMRSKARYSCLLADSSKVGATALAKNGTLADFDYFITDDCVPKDFLRLAEREVGTVITCRVEKAAG